MPKSRDLRLLITTGIHPTVEMLIVAYCLRLLLVMSYQFLILPKYLFFAYLNISRNVRTWIDNVFGTNFDVCDINSCDINSLDDGNVSDHLPIRILITLSVLHYNNPIPIETGHSY